VTVPFGYDAAVAAGPCPSGPGRYLSLHVGRRPGAVVDADRSHRRLHRVSQPARASGRPSARGGAHPGWIRSPGRVPPCGSGHPDSRFRDRRSTSVERRHQAPPWGRASRPLPHRRRLCFRVHGVVGCHARARRVRPHRVFDDDPTVVLIAVFAIVLIDFRRSVETGKTCCRIRRVA
jgi:hypothetical protein